MATLAWVRPENKSIRYHVDHDDGTFDESKLPAEEIRAEMARTHKSMKSIVAKRLDLDETPEVAMEVEPDAPEAAELVEVQRHTHAEFGLPVASHEHEHDHDVPEHEHTHTHPIEGHQHPLEPHEHAHEHDLPPHGHKALNIRLDDLEPAVEALRAPHHHEHEHPHDHSEATQPIIEALSRLNELVIQQELRLQQLEARPITDPAHEHAVPDHYHKIGPHEHPELTPQGKGRKAKAQDATDLHEHQFDEWRGDGRYHCITCGEPRPDELPSTGVSTVGR